MSHWIMSNNKTETESAMEMFIDYIQCDLSGVFSFYVPTFGLSDSINRTQSKKMGWVYIWPPLIGCVLLTTTVLHLTSKTIYWIQ